MKILKKKKYKASCSVIDNGIFGLDLVSHPRGSQAGQSCLSLPTGRRPSSFGISGLCHQLFSRGVRFPKNEDLYPAVPHIPGHSAQ